MKRVIKRTGPYGNGLGSSLGFTNARLGEDLALVARLDDAFSAVEGQDYALQAIKEYIFALRHRKNEKGVGGLLLFMGPPASGKTMTAELLAKAMDRPVLRVDMSTFNDKESGFDAFGINPSYKSAEEGQISGYVNKNPVCVLILDEFDKAHITVRNRFLQVFERGEVYDPFLKLSVSFRDAIIVVTTNVGKAIYNKSVTDYNFSQIPQSTLVKALKSEKIPESGEPCFSEALVSRFTSGKILVFNRLRPEVLHRVAVNVIAKQVAYYKELYEIKITLNADMLADMLLFSQGANADVRTISKAAQEFFERNLERIAKNSRTRMRGGFNHIKCEVDLSDASEKAKDLFSGKNKSRVLVCCDETSRERFTAAADSKTEFVFAGKETNGRSLAKLDLSAAIFDVGRKESVQLFAAAVKQNVPAYVYGGADPAVFDDYTDRGAIGRLLAEDGAQEFSPWLKRILGGLALSFVTQSLYRSNKVLSYEVSFSFKEETHRAKIVLGKLDVVTAMDAEDSALFVADCEIPDVTFGDVVGAKEAKRELEQALVYLKDHKTFLRMGVRIPRGFLLEGEPGTGKTMLAKALANAAELPFIQKNASEFINQLAGEGARLVRETFAAARRYAPCILFIDEIDAISRSRLMGDQASTDSVTNAFLSEMDGFADTTTAPVFVIAATNFNTRRGETVLDEAFLRRFDRRIYIDLPDCGDREKCLKGAIGKFGESKVSEEGIRNIARRSAGWSPADLTLVVQNAIRRALAEGSDLTDKALGEAFESFTDGDAKPRTLEQLKKTACHEAGHALVASLLGLRPSYTTITARGSFGGYVYYANEETSEFTREDLLRRVCVFLAGRAAEILVYGDAGVASGASSDLRAATETATGMVCDYGMADGVPMTFDRAKAMEQPFVREEIIKILREQAQRAETLVRDNRETLCAVAEALVERNSLDETELADIVFGEKKS